MILIDKIKTFDDEIIANEAQYKLDRETTKISVISSSDWKNINI